MYGTFNLKHLCDINYVLPVSVDVARQCGVARVENAENVHVFTNGSAQKSF